MSLAIVARRALAAIDAPEAAMEVHFGPGAACFPYRRTARRRSAHARAFDRQGKANAMLGTRDIDRLRATDMEGDQLLLHALARLLLSARAYHRMLRVVRIIDDLAGEAAIRAAHIAEAIQYRRVDAVFEAIVRLDGDICDRRRAGLL
jgi:hypothetical protein